MKKLQIPIEDELMHQAKIYALQNNITLKDLVISALTTRISYTTDTTDTISIASSTPTTTEPIPDENGNTYINEFNNGPLVRHIRTHDTHEVIDPEERYVDVPIPWDTDDPIEQAMLRGGMR